MFLVDTWRIRRRVLNKCFSQKQIYEFIPKYNEQVEILVNKLQPIMMAKDLRAMMMKNVLNTFFGKNVNIYAILWTSETKKIMLRTIYCSIVTFAVFMQVVCMFCI